MKQFDVIVIGGGAAGLMAAGTAAENGARVLLLEKMKQTGRKIGISGKGRCNITNKAHLVEFMDCFGKDGRFLRQCLEQFFNDDLISFFERRGLATVLERGGRYFPESGKALDVVHTLNNWLLENTVELKKEHPVTEIIVKDGAAAGVRTRSKTWYTPKIIVATGGVSYPRTGSTGDGFKLLKKFGHTSTPLRPALVSLTTPQKEVSQLSGLSLRNVSTRLFLNGKRKGMEFGEVNFTKRGLAGPSIITLSGTVVDALAKSQKVTLVLDLKPALDEKKLTNRLLRDFEKRGGEPIGSILRGILPRQLVAFCMDQCELEPTMDTKSFPLKKRKQLVQWLKNIRFEIDGHGSWDEAIITNGGINLKEINPRTMESRLVSNLYIAGELLNLQAATGGYNLQAAFSMGRLAGKSAASS